MRISEESIVSLFPFAFCASFGGHSPFPISKNHCLLLPRCRVPVAVKEIQSVEIIHFGLRQIDTAMTNDKRSIAVFNGISIHVIAVWQLCCNMNRGLSYYELFCIGFYKSLFVLCVRWLNT